MLAPHCRVKRCQSSLIPTEDVIASLSCLLYAGWCAGTVLVEGEVVEANHRYRFGYGVSASFAIFGLRRFKHRFLSEASDAGFVPFPLDWLADQVRCQRASHPKKCRFLTQAALSSYHSSSKALTGNTSYREKAHSPHPNAAGHFRGTPLSILIPVTGVQPRSDLAHEHGTTRCRRSPAMPGNKAFLLLALSDFSGLLQSVTFLADLHLVPVITTRPLITTPPPPSLLHAGMLASLSGEAVGEFPSSA